MILRRYEKACNPQVLELDTAAEPLHEALPSL